MKSLFSILALTFYAVSIANSQVTTDSVSYRAHYAMKHVVDKNKPNDTLVEDMLLLIGTHSTLFTSYTKLSYGYETTLNIEREANDVNRERGTPFNVKQQAGKFTLDDLYLFHQIKQHFVIGYLMDRYLFESEYPEQEWRIGTEQKEIMGLTCQYATTVFRGREWTAWFCPEVPVNVGPWQLHGLPGLIILAYDKPGDISFSLSKLESNSNASDKKDPVIAHFVTNSIVLPNDENIQKVEETAFLRLKELAQTNFNAYFDTRMRRNGFMDNPFSISMAWRYPIPNPIALAN